MANIKSYKIEINGLQESISAVDALNKELTNLEQRSKALEGKSVKVGASSSGGGSKSSSTSSLSEEENLQKQINQLEEKRIAHSKQIYQNYLAAKDVLKETENDQKQLAAQERLQAQTYSNTMAGMKQELADIKAVMQTVDIGDSGQMKQMVDRANELNTKLKEIEQSYGQFGRNVGNYAEGVAEGLNKVKINVGGTVREFDNAKQAAKTLGNELKTMAVNGQSNTEEFKQLRQVVLELESTMQDAKKPMDNLMDSMESLVAIANLGQGLRGLFGVDDAEIQKSIKNLVALQNILKGIQTINKQIQTREGIGSWIAPFSTQIDKATAKLLTFNTALLGTGKASKVAAVGINAFGKALKLAISAGILIAIDLLVEGLMKVVEGWKKVDEAAERQKETQKDIAKAYGEGMAKLAQYKAKVDAFNGSKKEEKKLVEELNKELGTGLGTYKSIAEWQDVLKNKSEAYIKTLMLQAKAQAALNTVTAAYQKMQEAEYKKSNGEYDGLWNRWFGKNYEAEVADAQKMLEIGLKAIEEAEKEIAENNKNNGLFDYSPQIKNNASKTKNAMEETQRTLNQLELRLMNEGLNKKLRQLDEEERQTIAKLKENGRKSAAAIQQVQRQYALLRQKEIQVYLNNLENTISQSAKNIEKIQFDINIDGIENQIDELENRFNQMSKDQPIRNTYISSTETKTVKKQYQVDDSKMDFAKRYENLFRLSEATNQADEYYKLLLNYVKDKDKELFQDIADYNEAIYKETDENQKQVYMKGLEDTFKKVSSMVEEEYANELLYIRNYTSKVDQTLTDSFMYRINSEKAYDENYRKILMENIAEQSKLNNKLINEEANAATLAEEERYQAAQEGLQKQQNILEKEIKNFTARNDKEKEQLEQLKQDLKNINDQMEQQRQQHYTKMVQITEETNNKLKKNEIDTANEIAAEKAKTFNNQIENLRDAQSKINELLSKQPVFNAFGIVNIGATKKQYKEIEDATRAMIIEIIKQKTLLNVAFTRGLIDPENMNVIKSQLNDIEAAFKEMLTTTVTESNQTIPKFVQSLQVYINGVMDSFNTIMNAVWDAQDVAFDKEQEQIDKENEMLQEALDKQEEMINEHKSKIDSIEDELSTARGDRRQHLIDQINAEIAAERAAQKEKEKLQKKEEANKRKQEQLERKRKKAEYERNILQAIVNGAMAVTMAAINTWPIPAIPMMALAASTTAAQLAIMASNKPYRVGGQLEGGLVTGKRHTQGGVPVGNTGIEVEGSEYIIRRESTTPNLNLLEFINKSQKKLDLSDFVEFYSDRPKRVIKNINKKMYADGGSLPTLPSQLDIKDQLRDIYVMQDQRPVYVAVTDILNKADDVRNVQVLAGLNPSTI